MDLDAYIFKLKNCQPLLEHEVKLLCDKAVEILVEESNVQRIDSPVTICACMVDGPHAGCAVLQCLIFAACFVVFSGAAWHGPGVQSQRADHPCWDHLGVSPLFPTRPTAQVGMCTASFTT